MTSTFLLVVVGEIYLSLFLQRLVFCCCSRDLSLVVVQETCFLLLFEGLNKLLLFQRLVSYCCLRDFHVLLFVVVPETC